MSLIDSRCRNANIRAWGPLPDVFTVASWNIAHTGAFDPR